MHDGAKRRPHKKTITRRRSRPRLSANATRPITFGRLDVRDTPASDTAKTLPGPSGPSGSTFRYRGRTLCPIASSIVTVT